MHWQPCCRSYPILLARCRQFCSRAVVGWSVCALLPSLSKTCTAIDACLLRSAFLVDRLNCVVRAPVVPCVADAERDVAAADDERRRPRLELHGSHPCWCVVPLVLCLVLPLHVGHVSAVMLRSTAASGLQCSSRIDRSALLAWTGLVCCAVIERLHPRPLVWRSMPILLCAARCRWSCAGRASRPSS